MPQRVANRRLVELLEAGRPFLSVEFFPPKNDEGGQQLLETAGALRDVLRPRFVSITYGAGGTTRERTLRYARLLKDDYGFEVMPHLTCVGSTRAELKDILQGYWDDGFRNIMALRGDPPKGESTFRPAADGLGYGSELVAFIRQHFPGFCLGAGAYPEKHPEAPDAPTDLAHLRRKVEAGTDFLTTQLFFDNAVYFRFVAAARAAGITVPIVPGLLPVLSLAQVRRFCTLCGASLPPALEARLLAAGEAPEAQEAVGVQWAAEQLVELLRGGAPGVHLYILNRSKGALQLLEQVRAAGVLV